MRKENEWNKKFFKLIKKKNLEKLKIFVLGSIYLRADGKGGDENLSCIKWYFFL